MRKKLRKPLAFLMAVLMMLSVMGVQVLAEDTGPSDTISTFSETVTEVQEESKDGTEVQSTQEENAVEEQSIEKEEVQSQKTEETGKQETVQDKNINSVNAVDLKDENESEVTVDSESKNEFQITEDTEKNGNETATKVQTENSSQKSETKSDVQSDAKSQETEQKVNQTETKNELKKEEKEENKAAGEENIDGIETASEEQIPDSAEPQFAGGQSAIQVFSTGSGNRSLSHQKYVEYNEADDTYDLNLTVSGAIGTKEGKVPLDVLLVVDKSGSMKKKMTGNGDGSKRDGDRRIDSVVKATKGLTDTLQANTNLDVRYSVVTFSGPNDFYTKGSDSDASVDLDWSNQASNAYNTVNNIKPSGATNYEAGIKRAITQLGKAREEAQKIVIFLTDGMPTVRKEVTPCQEYTDERPAKINEAEIKKNNDAAVTAIKNMTADTFYCIGAGPWFSNDTSFPVKNLDELCSNVKAETSKRYTATDTTELNKVFEDIAAEQSIMLCDHVDVTDELSENVQVVMSNGKPQKLIVTVTDENNNNVVQPAEFVTLLATDQNSSATIRAVYQDGKLRMIFPESYKLEPYWTYKVTATISATEKAYQNYKDAGDKYPDTGEAETGITSAGKPGLRSNDSANVTYVYNDVEKTEPYNNPVIQLHLAKVTITKKVEGNMRNVNQKFEFRYAVNGEQQDSIYLKDGESESITIPRGAEVKVEEIGAGEYVTTYVYIIGNSDEVSGSGKEITLENVATDANITVTNTRNMNPPTGVNPSSFTPFAILFTAGISSLMGAMLWMFLKRKYSESYMEF